MCESGEGDVEKGYVEGTREGGCVKGELGDLEKN